MTRRLALRTTLPRYRRLPLRLEALDAKIAPAVIFVSSLADSGPGSLRDAIGEANNTSAPDVIQIQVTGTLNLTGGELGISSPLTIVGPGRNNFTIDAGGLSRVFQIGNETGSPNVCSITGLTITNANSSGATPFNAGGAIRHVNGELELFDVVISNSTGSLGGAIYSSDYSRLTMNKCVVSGNSAPFGGGGVYLDYRSVAVFRDCIISGNSATSGHGGGVYADSGASVTFQRSTISNNTAGSLTQQPSIAEGGSLFADGGGIYMDRRGGLTIQDSTINNNTASRSGGGIDAALASLLVENSTVSGNVARRAAGVYLDGYYYDRGNIVAGEGYSGGPALIRNSTIVSNAAFGFSQSAFTNGGPLGIGGGVSSGRDVTIINTIIANNTADSNPDVDTFNGAQMTIDFSLIETAGSATIVTVVGGNIFDTDPVLGPLQNNGGPTATHALLMDSPAINVGDPNFVFPPGTDQRGSTFARVAGVRLDMGAFELQNGFVCGIVTIPKGEINAPVANAFVWLDVNGNGAPDCDEVTGFTDQNGEFCLEAPPGIYTTMVACKAGQVIVETPTGSIEVVAGETIEGQDFTLGFVANVQVFSGAGANPAAIQSAVDAFRTQLGTLNPNNAGTQNNGNGRREINWDGVPAGFSSPNNLPANFFNSNSPRGAVFSSLGTGFQVSGIDNGAGIEFANLNTNNPGYFQTFSPQKLFTPLGTNVMDVTFFVPGSNTPAAVSGFGAVFTDVDNPVYTRVELFNADGVSAGTFCVPQSNNGLSFVGFQFTDGTRISKVRITTGNTLIGANDGGLCADVVVMDDFIYGEPVALTSPPPPPPPPVSRGLFAVGAGAGSAALVSVYDGEGDLVAVFDAYPNFQGGVHVATADINADGIEEVITGPGPGGGPHVQVFDGAKLLNNVAERIVAGLGSYFAYNPFFQGGVFVSTGDVNGDGRPDIITGAGPGGGPHVIAWDNVTSNAIVSFYAYDPNFTGGVSVGAGDTDGDGKAEIVTGALAGGGPHVKIFNNKGAVVNEYFAYDANFTGGVYVAMGDMNGDGKADVMTGAGAGATPHVKVYNNSTQSLIFSRFAFVEAFAGGVRVAPVNVGPGANYMAVAAGPGGGPHIRIVDLQDTNIASFYNFDDPLYPFGVFVG